VYAKQNLLCHSTLRFRISPLGESFVHDAHLREALSVSPGRVTTPEMLLRMRTEPTVALLSERLSGYAFLLNVETNPARAKDIQLPLPANVASASQPLCQRVDAPAPATSMASDPPGASP